MTTVTVLIRDCLRLGEHQTDVRSARDIGRRLRAFETRCWPSRQAKATSPARGNRKLDTGWSITRDAATTMNVVIATLLTMLVTHPPITPSLGTRITKTTKLVTR